MPETANAYAIEAGAIVLCQEYVAAERGTFEASEELLRIGNLLMEAPMGRGLLLWLIGIPIPIILLIWLFGGLHG